MTKAIDAWCNIFTHEGMEKYYRSVEGIMFAFKLFKREYMLEGSTVEEFLAKMDAAGVDKVCIPAYQVKKFQAEMLQAMPMEELAKVIDQAPDRLIGMAGIHPFRRMDAVRDIQRGVEEFGFKAAHIHPYGFGIPINDATYYPMYAKCVELDIPVEIQVGHSAEQMPSAVGKPLLLDDIAIYFPELRIIAAHIGWPWVDEMIAITWKHPNVYIATSAHAPKYWNPTFVKFLNSRGMNKVLYATDFPVLNHEETLAQIAELGLKEKVLPKFLRENAIKVFKL
ncbi:MAG: amidohydrolase [Candidatus Helarchaeota archaeon]|nr:amidohydrolase [Candidatus Helarchaeota archaeon]